MDSDEIFSFGSKESCQYLSEDSETDEDDDLLVIDPPRKRAKVNMDNDNRILIEDEKLRYNLDNIDALNQDELDELETALQNKINELKSGIESEIKAREDWIDDNLNCIFCSENRKNIIIEGCNHVDICDECESKLERKNCPRCGEPFKNVLKINFQ